MAEEQKRQSPGRKRRLRRLQAVLFGTDGVRERPQRNSDQLPVRLGVCRLQVFGVLAPSHAAVTHGIRLDLTLPFDLVHIQPFTFDLRCIISQLPGIITEILHLWREIASSKAISVPLMLSECLFGGKTVNVPNSKGWFPCLLLLPLLRPRLRPPRRLRQPLLQPRSPHRSKR